MTLDGVRLGAVMTLPMMPSMFFFGAAFGALAAQKGMTLGEAVLFSGLTFAGASQFAAMEAWRESWSLAGLVAIGAIVCVVNLRLFLMSAALRPWLQELPPSFVYPQFFLLTDVNYILASRHRMQGGADAGVLVGSGLVQWALWAFSAAPGYMVASLTNDPERYGIDLIMPIAFATMSSSLWKSHRDTRNWAIAGAAALAAMYVIPGHWHIIIGAAAGMLSAAFLDGDKRA